MFTGIIQHCESIIDIQNQQECRRWIVHKPKDWILQKGESINIDGVCSTVVEVTNDTFHVEYMPETLRMTTMNFKQRGALCNLERSVTTQTLLSGHMVYGHVDAMGTLERIETEGETRTIYIRHQMTNKKFVVQKGSISLNGISLTIVNATPEIFSVALIPYTWEHTNLHTLHQGDSVNLEYDIIAKYLLHFYEQTSNHS